MNPRQFLLIGGIVLIVVGLLGLIGIIGPVPESSIFGSIWWFDDVENWAHLILGVVAVALVYASGMSIQKTVTLLVGILALIVGLWGFLVSGQLLGANLENPLDNLLHLVVGVWGLWAWRGAKKTSFPQTTSM